MYSTALSACGFTVPTMYRWIVSERARAMTMHPFMNARYPGSGPGPAVIAEAELDGEAQYRRIVAYAHRSDSLVRPARI